MDNQADNNQKVQTIELTQEQQNALIDGRFYIDKEIANIESIILGLKEKGLSPDAMERIKAELLESSERLQGIINLSTFLKG